MAVKTYGTLIVDKETRKFIITECEPHVSIKLKTIFSKVKRWSTPPYEFFNTPENAADLLWLTQRYPMKISPADRKLLERAERVYKYQINRAEAFRLPGYKTHQTELKPPAVAREYQLAARDLFYLVKRGLLADDLGLGKTLSAILLLLEPHALPGVVVVQTHLPKQWKEYQIERFTNLKVHLINTTTPYPLPEADVYIFKYSNISGWVNAFESCFFKTVIFDEVQELRRSESMKHQAGRKLSSFAEFVLGLSATPIYNFGDEIFNIIDLINPQSLGLKDDFLREWATPIGNNKYKIREPSALGTYLRDNNLMLRRTRKDVGRELPPINKIVVPVDYDAAQVESAMDLAKILAQKVFSGDFEISGQASRELDILIRRITGISKARSIALYVRMLLEAGERLILCGWHRTVYEIWLEELAEFKPAMYTGSESPAQKNASFESFTKKETNLFIISNRSGAGLDGLQKTCSLICHGELDWSGQVHDQLNGRVNRDESEGQVTALYFTSDWGSDPPMIELLGLKASQSHGILNPGEEPLSQHTDEARIKKLAKQFLELKNG